MTNTPTYLESQMINIINMASGLWDLIVPVVLAVVGLGIVVSFVKKLYWGDDYSQDDWDEQWRETQDRDREDRQRYS